MVNDLPISIKNSYHKPFERFDKPFGIFHKPFERFGKPFEKFHEPCERFGEPFEKFHEPFKRLGCPFGVLNKPFSRSIKPFQTAWLTVRRPFDSRSSRPFNGKPLVYVFA